MFVRSRQRDVANAIRALAKLFRIQQPTIMKASPTTFGQRVVVGQEGLIEYTRQLFTVHGEDIALSRQHSSSRDACCLIWNLKGTGELLRIQTSEQA